MKDRFIAYDAYKELAEKYAEIIDVKPHNAEYERPGLLKVIPSVKGKMVLDAGSGSGSLTQWLLDHGATVIGVDASPHMLEHARKRIKDRATLILHDLREPLDFIEEDSMDLVTSSLVMHYIDVLEPVFREFHRVLKPRGHLVFSIEHPFTGFVYRPSESYYKVEVVSYDWTGFTDEPVSVPGYRRPLEGYTEALARTGFCIERLTEPVPTDRFREQLPDSYARHIINPLFMIIRARANIIS
jgi:SAM-dependent methyltransferase